MLLKSITWKAELQKQVGQGMEYTEFLDLQILKIRKAANNTKATSRKCPQTPWFPQKLLKAEFLERTKKAMIREQGVPWEFIELKVIKEIDDTSDDGKFIKMDPDFRTDATYARKEFGDKKPELVDYMLWMLKFVTKSEYVEW